MAFDLIIRGGTVVDGTGAPPVTADVAVDGDRIAEVGRVEGRARREIDADGLVVTPGFVDIHTHLDAQMAWDPLGTSASWHGVTSVVLGNCGVTFAPVAPGGQQVLAEMMESVEDIPASSILDGLSWNWETYGDYLDELDRLPKGLNVGGMVGHCAVRLAAMGERAMDETPAAAEDIAAMATMVDQALASGALGFSTSRTLLHKVPDGLSPELAGVVTPMANGIQWALFDCKVGYDSRVLIQGPGQQGLSQVVACKQAGASLIMCLLYTSPSPRDRG